ncbi:unnamed protein product [Ectocarpus sp. CCAP 1310/34]|nr:unnamed protein product [Ectocarpus sp. CCAP 1310/34]
MKAPVCVVLLSHCCAAFTLSPATLLSLQRSCAFSAAEHVSSPQRSCSSSSSRSNRCQPDRRRQRPPGGSRVPSFALGAAKDWLKGGSQGKSGPEGPKTGSVAAGTSGKSGEVKKGPDGEDLDPRLYSVRIARATGIEWGTDISFSWVYIRALQPDGAAANCGEISVGDQLIAINDQTLTGAPFDVAMDAMIALEGPDVEFTFFRGSTEELKEVVGAEAPRAEITVTVKQEGKPELVLTAPSGANLRDFLTENGINVYQSVTRWTNCKGKQLCGTCIVAIDEGLEGTTIRSVDESSTLRDNPPNYRLSCVTNMYDDVTVTVFPPVGAAQWTR